MCKCNNAFLNLFLLLIFNIYLRVVNLLCLNCRENTSIELEGLTLVSLLQTCLNHNLRPSVPDAAPPHAKIAADIVACIFLVNKHYLIAVKCLVHTPIIEYFFSYL